MRVFKVSKKGTYNKTDLEAWIKRPSKDQRAVVFVRDRHVYRVNELKNSLALES